jgi:hypothetical protein
MYWLKNEGTQAKQSDSANFSQYSAVDNIIFESAGT